jgi:hypothetical protein
VQMVLEFLGFWVLFAAGAILRYFFILLKALRYALPSCGLRKVCRRPQIDPLVLSRSATHLLKLVLDPRSTVAALPTSPVCQLQQCAPAHAEYKPRVPGCWL